mmetsp:Transcript_24164/g.75888  ORF Transcript_24164/g.75888 Transcript_24164/m.75888 type:complete len:216 (-) Transcript_24164:540-1187(-)
MDPEVLDLHHALLAGEVHLRLEVHVGRLVVVEQVHGAQALGLPPELRAVGRLVHHGGEEAALHALRGPQLVVEGHDLVAAHGDPLRDDQVHVVQQDVLRELVLDVGDRLAELINAVEVHRHVDVVRLEALGEVGRGHVRHRLDVRDAAHVHRARVGDDRELLLLLLPADPHQLRLTAHRVLLRQHDEVIHRLSALLVEELVQVLLAQRGDAHGDL